MAMSENAQNNEGKKLVIDKEFVFISALIVIGLYGLFSTWFTVGSYSLNGNSSNEGAVAFGELFFLGVLVTAQSISSLKPYEKYARWSLIICSFLVLSSYQAWYSKVQHASSALNIKQSTSAFPGLNSFLNQISSLANSYKPKIGMGFYLSTIVAVLALISTASLKILELYKKNSRREFIEGGIFLIALMVSGIVLNVVQSHESTSSVSNSQTTSNSVVDSQPPSGFTKFSQNFYTGPITVPDKCPSKDDEYCMAFKIWSDVSCQNGLKVGGGFTANKEATPWLNFSEIFETVGTQKYEQVPILFEITPKDEATLQNIYTGKNLVRQDNKTQSFGIESVDCA